MHMPPTSSANLGGYVQRPGRATRWVRSGGAFSFDGIDTAPVSKAGITGHGLLAGVEAHTVPTPIKPAEISPLAQGDDLVIPDVSQQQPNDLLQGLVPALAGFVTLNPEWDGVVCCPGGTSYWVHISAQEIVSFQGFASMDIAQALLAAQANDTWDESAFLSALDTCMSRPERMAQLVHTARLGPCPGEQIHGAVIGAELAASRAYWLGQQVAVLGPETATDFTASLYASALDAQGLAAMRVDEDRMVQAGLTQLHRNI